MKSKVPANSLEVLVQYKDPQQFISSNILMHTGMFLCTCICTSVCNMQICNYTHTYIYMIKMRSNKYSVCVCTYEDNFYIYIMRWLSVLNHFLVNLLRVKAKEALPTCKRKNKKNPVRRGRLPFNTEHTWKMHRSSFHSIFSPCSH